MTAVDAGAIARLRAGLPILEPATELILRTDDGRPSALLRPQGAPPRAFALTADGVRELRLADDAGLPAAAVLADDARLGAALQPALGAIAAPRLVAWRPGRRAVLRVLCGGSPVFVKFLDRKTWKRAQATFAALGTPPPPLTFARASVLLPELCAYAAPAAPGTALRDLLARGVAPDWHLVDAAVRALAATPVAAGPAVHDFAAARAAAVKMLQKALPVDPVFGELAERTAALTGPAHLRSGLVHGDLHDKQLFLDNGAAHLIDLEGIDRGDPTFDQVNLAEHLRLRALQQGGDDDGSAAALLDRLGVDADLRRPWTACIRARLCGVYALRPRWAALTRRLVDETRSCLPK